MQRHETGPMTFHDDWPGFFMRGDDALSLSRTLNRLAAELEQPEPAVKLTDIAAYLRGHAADLARCAV